MPKESYRIQVKNYPNVSDESIKIDNNVLSINGNKNSFDEADNNVLVVNSALIETDDEFMGFACVRKENITIIPLTPKKLLINWIICLTQKLENFRLYI